MGYKHIPGLMARSFGASLVNKSLIVALFFLTLTINRRSMSMYQIVHKETGQTIIISQDVFNRNEILEQASTEMGTALDIKKYGEYKIHPQVI